jgi:hypothetical protein
LDRAVGPELRAHVDRFIRTDQHTTRSAVGIGLQIAYGISPRVNSTPQKRIAADQPLYRAI